MDENKLASIRDKVNTVLANEGLTIEEAKSVLSEANESLNYVKERMLVKDALLLYKK